MTSYDHDNPRLAETYHRISEPQLEGGKRLVEKLGIERGGRVLDVGCGTGRLARWIAEMVGPEGEVAGIDPLADRIAIARQDNDGIRFEVGSAEDLGRFADGSFDRVCLNAVFHWIEDKPRALAEVWRVLRPGGRVGITTVPRETFWAATVHNVCALVLSRSPYLEQIDPAAVGVLDRNIAISDLLALFAEEKLDLVELQVTRREQVFESGREVVDFVESSSFGTMTALVPEEVRDTLRAELAEAFEEIKLGGRIVLHGHTALFVAERS